MWKPNITNDLHPHLILTRRCNEPFTLSELAVRVRPELVVAPKQKNVYNHHNYNWCDFDSPLRVPIQHHGEPMQVM